MQDYKPTPYLIEHVHLDFLLNEDKSTVKSKLHMTPNYGDASTPPKLELDGKPFAVSFIRHHHERLLCCMQCKDMSAREHVSCSNAVAHVFPAVLALSSAMLRITVTSLNTSH